MSKRKKILSASPLAVTQTELIRQIPLTISVAFLTLFLSAYDPEIVVSPLYILGAALILLATCASILVPMNLAPRWQLFFPLLDVAGVSLISAHVGAELLCVLFLIPVMWLATSSTRSLTIITCGVVTVVTVTTTIATSTVLTADQTLWIFIFPVVMFVLAMAANNSGNVIAARGRLLSRQLESTLILVERERLKQQSLDFALNATEMAILRIDKAGRTILANHAHQALLEKFGAAQNSDDVGALYRSDRVTPIDNIDRPFSRALRGVAADREVVWIGHPGEDQRARLLSVRCFFDANGQPDGAILASTDITEDMLTIAYRQDFVMTVSHEIRNPLTSVIGNLDLVLEDEELSPQVQQNLTTASINALRILDLVTGMLDSVSSETTSRTLDLEPTELYPLIQRSAKSIQSASNARNITVEIAVQVDLIVDIDATHMLQVIDNLMSNAVKYNVDGGKIRVTTRTVKSHESVDGSAENHYVELRVTDSGRGISLIEQKHLFQRFYRAKSVRGSSIHGTGLGLHISRELMRSMGGDLLIESLENSGTSAICVFPLSRELKRDSALSPLIPQLTSGETRAP